MTNGIFVCDCGTRLHILTEDQGKEDSVIPCPNLSCKTRHIVSGLVRQVEVDREGTWVFYDWTAHVRR